MNPRTSIGVIGDVHCEHQSLAAAIVYLHHAGIETIVCTGDIPTGPGDNNVCCALLSAHQIPTVRGNHDRWLMTLPLMTLPFATPRNIVARSSWTFLQSLPVTLDLPTSIGNALLCHGLGEHDMLSILPRYTDAELDENPVLDEIENCGRYHAIINGHSHERMVRQFRSLTIINAGTLRRDHEPCFAAIDFEERRVSFWNIIDQRTIVQSDHCFEWA